MFTAVALPLNKEESSAGVLESSYCDPEGLLVERPCVPVLYQLPQEPFLGHATGPQVKQVLEGSSLEYMKEGVSCNKVSGIESRWVWLTHSV